MSKATRSSSETEDIWETEEDDMTEGDLGCGLGRRPGGVYEVSCSITSKKRSAGKNLSPPLFPRNGEERSETIFQYSRNKGLQDMCAHGCGASSYRRQSSTILNQRYLEALAMLDIKQQKMAQENMVQEDSGFAEVSGLEVCVHQ
ncbi:coiled-coil domain containing 125 [Cricetulus griseus]